LKLFSTIEPLQFAVGQCEECHAPVVSLLFVLNNLRWFVQLQPLVMDAGAEVGRTPVPASDDPWFEHEHPKYRDTGLPAVRTEI
jgi:hypothetical protein